MQENRYARLSGQLARLRDCQAGEWLNGFTSGGLAGLNAADGTREWSQPVFGDRFGHLPAVGLDTGFGGRLSSSGARLIDRQVSPLPGRR